MLEFKSFQKIPRYSRECIITEKIDGTNASIYIGGEVDNGEQGLAFERGIDRGNSIYLREDNVFLVASRTRWITPQDDNQGFANWAYEHKEELLKLGPGQHFGEWWGKSIQRTYGLTEKRFSLFNVSKWTDEVRPNCCGVVPILYKGMFTSEAIELTLAELKGRGSQAVLGYMNPEGIVIYHMQSGHYYKKTIVGDEKPKGVIDETNTP